MKVENIVILVGGRGSRLGSLTSKTPKPLIKINRKPVLDHLICKLIKYNFKRPVVGLGSCIFLHLTQNYKPTAGCIALKKKDFLIMLKIIKKKTKIRIN